MASGGGSGDTSRTVSTQELSPEQRQLMKGVVPVAQNYLKTPLELYPKSTVAGFTPAQAQGQKMVSNAATGQVAPLAQTATQAATSFTGQGGNLALQGAGAQLGAAPGSLNTLGDLFEDYDAGNASRNFLMSGALLDPATNPILGRQMESAIRPATTAFTRSVLPNIRGEFAANNQFGSSRHGVAEANATDSYMNTIGDILANIQSNNFNQGLSAMTSANNTATQAATAGIGAGLGAVGQGATTAGNLALQSMLASPQLAELAYSPGLAVAGVGQQQQQMDQALKSEAANRFMTKQMLPFMQAQDVASLAMGLGGGSAVTDSTQSRGGVDPLSTGMGVGQLALLAASLFL